jgi:penicillin-binding protein 2
LVTKIQKANLNTVEMIKPKVHDRIFLNMDNIEIVKKAMIDVTLPGGTAALVGNGAAYQVAGKTGTAQVVGIKQNEKYDASAINERNRDHALFIAYAPADDPKIALGIVVENGEHGGSGAGPIARKVMDYYLLGIKPPEVDVPNLAITANNIAAQAAIKGKKLATPAPQNQPTKSKIPTATVEDTLNE